MIGTTRANPNEGSRFNGTARQRLNDLVLSSDGHAFDPKTGRSYRINPTGLLALQLAQEGKSEPEVISQLAARYAQHPAVVAVSTEAFFSQIKRYLP
jgi:hypothetical protein